MLLSQGEGQGEGRAPQLETGFHGAPHRKGDGIRVFGGAAGADRTQITANDVFGNAANGIRIDSRSKQDLATRRAAT